MTATVLSSVIEQLLAYRGWTSPEKLAQNYLPPRKPPLSGATIRRIMDDDETLDGDEGRLKLVRLAGMLDLPLESLIYVRDMDAEAVRRLDFSADDGHLRQFIANTIDQAWSPPPPATRRKRA